MVSKALALLLVNLSQKKQNSVAPRAYIPLSAGNVTTPPIYRTGSGNAAQPKVGPGSGPPPVYRPGLPSTTQLKVAWSGARMPQAGAPPIYRPLFAGSVQRAEAGGRSSSNANAYSSLALSYTPEQIAQAQQEALGQNIHGHRSGNSTSGVSQQTKTDTAKVVDVLRANKAKAKAAKKKPTIREKSAMSDFAKAKQKAEALKSEGLGLGDFMEYLDHKGFALSEAEEAELYRFFA